MTPPTPPAGRENDISMLKIPEKKPAGKWLKLLTWTVILLAAVFGLGMWAMQDDAGNVRYRTRPSFIGDITVTVSATGNLQFNLGY